MNIFDYEKIESFFGRYDLNELEDKERAIEISEEINDEFSSADLTVIRNIVEIQSKSAYHQQTISMGMWAAILALFAILVSGYMQQFKFGTVAAFMSVIIYSIILVIFHKKINNDIQKMQKIEILINVADRYKTN